MMSWDAMSKMLTLGNNQVSSINKMQGKGREGGEEQREEGPVKRDITANDNG